MIDSRQRAAWPGRGDQPGQAASTIAGQPAAQRPEQDSAVGGQPDQPSCFQRPARRSFTGGRHIRLVGYRTILRHPPSLRSLDVEAMCKIYADPTDLTEALMGLAKETKARGWWHAYGDVIPEDFDVYIGLEGAASQHVVAVH
jgi:hypothetical protein